MIDNKRWHPSITDKRIAEAVSRSINGPDWPAFCLICGGETTVYMEKVRHYPCKACGARQVFGAWEFLIHLAPE
jgi:xanthine/CO dehydrogenase XdhC/CoxF family maturation factor